MRISKRTAYHVKVDTFSRTEWSAHLRFFEDATIYQTWDYGDVLCSRQQQISRLMLYRNNTVVGLAQVHIVTLPFISRGLASVSWGPVWRRKRVSSRFEILSAIIDALREEYSVRRKLVLRVQPHIDRAESTEALRVLEENGFSIHRGKKPYKTFVVDLSRSLPEIRRTLTKNWRRDLNRAERNCLEIRQGTSNNHYAEFLSIYRELIARKRFETGVNAFEFSKLQDALPDHEKSRVFLAYHERKRVAGTVVSGLGSTGIWLLGATSNYGLKYHGSNLLTWRAIEWLKNIGCQFFDLGGINPEKSPGPWRFKRRIGGMEISHIGLFECWGSVMSKIVVTLGGPLRKFTHKIVTNQKLRMLSRQHGE